MIAMKSLNSRENRKKARILRAFFMYAKHGIHLGGGSPLWGRSS